MYTICIILVVTMATKRRTNKMIKLAIDKSQTENIKDDSFKIIPKHLSFEEIISTASL